MTRLVPMLLLLSLCGCQASQRPTVAPPELGDHAYVQDRTKLFAISSSQLSPHTTVEVAGTTFVVAVDRESRITFIQPMSPNFRTPEGLSLGSTLQDVLSSGGSPVRNERGWAQYSTLPSGWRAAFPMGDVPPSPDSKVTSFFKRR
jgi:hypothetical protein